MQIYKIKMTNHPEMVVKNEVSLHPVMKKESIRSFIRSWMLVIGMVTGASAYLVYHAIPAIHFCGPALDKTMSVIQPSLLFAMLFLTFCRIEPRDMRPHRWQIWLLLIQTGLYAILSLILIAFPESGMRCAIEAAMLCMICPTATACAVVTGRLGGSMAGVLSYTVLINLLVAVLIPLMVPLTNPMEGLDFMTASALILAKVFPLLILPCVLAWIVRYVFPRLHARLLAYTDLSFYIWAVSLTLAIAMSTRYIVRNEDSQMQLAAIAAASAICCAFQFWAGRRIGRRYGCEITAGQALGQKNTVFAIWVGYTFLTPIVSVAGGFYSIWHNCFNTWQLRRMEQQKGNQKQ